MGNTGDHIRGFAHRMTYEEYEELEDTVTEMFRHKKEGDSVEGFDPSFLNGAAGLLPPVQISPLAGLPRR